jgi:hypothetical protein
MKKFIIAALLVFAPMSASAASLTHAQVSAILGLLQAFGADASIIENVQASLGMQTEKPAFTALPEPKKKDIELVQVASSNVGIPDSLILAKFSVTAKKTVPLSAFAADIEWLQMPRVAHMPDVEVRGPKSLSAGQTDTYTIRASGYPKGANIGFVVKQFGYAAGSNSYYYQGDKIISYISTY